MSFVDITSKVELELATGVWTDITTPYIDNQSEVRWDHGVDPFSRQPQSSTASFNLDNSTEVWSATNTASAYFNKFRQGIRVRISTVYSAVTKVEFLGTITDIKEYIPTFGPANLRVAVSCEGLSARLTDDEYGMAKLEDVDVDDALIAIATAAGITDYSFEATTTKLPVVIPQNGPMGDMVSVALGEPGSLLFEDGSGLNWLNAASMTGGHASPDHTWGSTIAPENDLEPDWRLQALVARQKVTFSVLQVSAEDAVLYRHPFNANNSPEKLAASSQRFLTGTFSAYPDSVYAKFEPVIIAFVHSGTSLYAAIDSAQTTLQTNGGAGNQFRRGSVIKIDSEIMLVNDATVTGQGYTNQLLTVERGYLNSIPANHTAPASPQTIIYHRPMQVTLVASPVFIGGSAGTFSGTGSTFKLAGQGFGTTVPINPAVGDVYQFDNEIVTVIAPLPASPTQAFTFGRGDYGTNDVTHAAQTRGYKVSFTPTTDIVAATYIKASGDPSGIPTDSPDIVGVPAFGGADHIIFTGNKFRAGIRNNSSSATRWISELVIGGKVLRSSDEPAEIVFEKAIPYVLGIPEGDDRSLPFGTADIDMAKGFAVGLLRAGRRPSPWLSVTFTANISDNVTVRLAKIGDLVRYTGTGSNREDIDEWFRIVSVAGWIDEDGLNQRTFLLMPSHLNRKASAAWYTNFSWRNATGLGEFLAKGVGSAGWTNDSEWGYGTSGLGFGGSTARGLVNAPSPALINAGSGDHVVSTQVEWGNPANNTYPANTGGAGVTFRANSGATQKWEARFNRTTSKIYLWNTTDGVVTSVDWTVTEYPEIEVMAQGTRIRVYVDCAALPVIDWVSTRFQTNTWIGPALNRTTINSQFSQPGFVDFYGQVI